MIQLGRLQEARGCLEKTIELSPEHADAFRLLTQIRKSSLSDPAIPRMVALCASDSIPEDEKKLLHFAMGKVYEDAADYDKAFMHYFAGNSIHRRKVNYEAKETVNRIDALTKFFTRSL